MRTVSNVSTFVTVVMAIRAGKHAHNQQLYCIQIALNHFIFAVPFALDYARRFF
jgi:hypothetical protein